MTGPTPGALSTFLLRNGSRIDHSWIVSDQAVVMFRSDVSVESVIDAMAELITLCQPRAASLMRGSNTVKLEW